MNKPLKSLIPVLLLITIWTGANRLLAQSGIFDRTGIIPGHGSHSSLPEESVDLFTGNLTLAYRDIFLPGSDNLNIEVWRVYNSKILQDRLMSQQNPTVQAYPKSMVGIGWSMHMGMVHNLSSNTPVIEFPDGRRETAFPPKSEYDFGPTIRITRDFLKFDKGTPLLSDPKLYFPNGVVWTFGNIASLPLASGGTETVSMVTRIEDPLGNFIDIEYDSLDDLRSISKITDGLEREVRFIKSYQGSDPAKLSEIRIRNYDDTHDVVLSYSVGSFSNGFYKLASFTPPGLPAATYGYNSGLSNNYELTSVTMNYGGTLEYTYQNHNFYFNTTQLDSKVVGQKRITFNPGGQGTWNYAYPTYQGASSGTATVDGPEFDTSATHYAYESSSANRWRIGLQTSLALSDGSYSASKTWTYHEISTTYWSVLGVNMGTAKGPLVLSATDSPTGDSTLRTDYYYLRGGGADVKRYGLPTKLSFFINGSPSAKSYKELAYFFETHANFKSQYMLSYVESTRDKSVTGALLRESINSYFDETGKWGALKQMKRWKAGTTTPIYSIWDFTYSRVASNVTISIDGPGEAGVTQVKYQYGLEKEVSTPGFLKCTRMISKYGYIEAEWNQYGGTKSYVYDDLGRPTTVELTHDWVPGEPQPAPFLAISYNWRPNGENRVEITHGDNTTIQYWDGMGRGTGYTETGDETTLFYRKTLDAEGRATFVDSGHTSSTPEYAYLYDAAGRVTRITDPLSDFTTIAYSGHTRTITDPENHSTVYYYADLPGLPTSLTDAQSHAASYTYDPAGRLTTVSYLGRTQTYGYDGLDHVTSEEHPETGPIQYAYDTANRLSLKSWGSVSQSFDYNSSGQLVSTHGAETVTYVYDDMGAVSSVTGSSGWSRSGIIYNDFGAVTHESITIPGLPGPKSLSYEYDDEGNLTRTTYPDMKEAVQAFNGLGRPETLNFDLGNTVAIIDSASYGPNKIPASIAAANGTTLGSTFYDNGTPHEVSFMRGGTPLYNATYDYDGAGNITGITSSAPTPALNSTFGYDSLNRLTSASYSTGDTGIPTAYTYDYDAYGNMRTVRHNGVIAFNMNYTQQNRIDDIAYQYDARGNLTTASGRNFIWDAENRLRAVTDAAGQFMAEYAYDDRGLRIAKLAPRPDIDVDGFPAGSGADFTVNLNSDCFLTFTIFNRGYNYLNLGTISITGQDSSMFNVSQQPSSPISPGQSTQLVVRFHPTSTGDKTALLSIASNDPDENLYLITLHGYCVPDISVGGVQGGTYDFGTVTIGESGRHVFTTSNVGTATLLLYGTPSVEQSGGGLDFFYEQEGGAWPSSISASGSALFAVRFAPMCEGQLMATLSINSSDPDEDPYTITLIGTGQNGTEKIIDESELSLLSPAGGESLAAGSFQDIRWTGGEQVKCVKLEYSIDNGSTFRTIADRVANICSFPWRVPEEASGSCLVRISDADGATTMPVVISFEFNFRVSSLGGDIPEGGEHFVFRAGVPDPKTQTYQVAEIAFAPDGLKGTENLLFNHAVWEIQGSEPFLGRWHRARVAYDMTGYTGSVWIDSEPVLVGVPLQPDLNVQDRPEVSIARGESIPVEIWIDDVDVRFLDASRPGNDTKDVAFRPLFRDNFNRYEGALFPRQGGWAPGAVEVKAEDKFRSEAAGEIMKPLRTAQSGEEVEGPVIDDRVYASSSKSFKLEASGEEPARATKRFSLPVRVPYDVSAETFSIVAPGETAQTANGMIPSEDGSDEPKRQKRWDDSTTGGTQRQGARKDPGSSSSAPGTVRRESAARENGAKTMSGVPVTGTFYIYAFDGRLLAEYDVNGQLVRDYIYFGGMLVAEYRNQDSRLLYYASDQINSTRIVTDTNGTVVYSAAHEPYGGIQKTWVSSYDPSFKFSGKERDAESDLDYFGARYYDRSLYRFLSVDPVSDSGSDFTRQGRLNLYAYCTDNPVSFIDPDGREAFRMTVTRTYYGITMTTGAWELNGMSGSTLELQDLDNMIEKSCIPPGIYQLLLHLWKGREWTIELAGTSPRDHILVHPGTLPEHTTGCILVGKSMKAGVLQGSGGAGGAWASIMEWYWQCSWDAFWNSHYLESRLLIIQDAEALVIIVSVEAKWVI
jgi:RHS repeat-associated protein